MADDMKIVVGVEIDEKKAKEQISTRFNNLTAKVTKFNIDKSALQKAGSKIQIPAAKLDVKVNNLDAKAAEKQLVNLAQKAQARLDAVQKGALGANAASLSTADVESIQQAVARTQASISSLMSGDLGGKTAAEAVATINEEITAVQSLALEKRRVAEQEKAAEKAAAEAAEKTAKEKEQAEKAAAEAAEKAAEKAAKETEAATQKREDAISSLKQKVASSSTQLTGDRKTRFDDSMDSLMETFNNYKTTPNEENLRSLNAALNATKELYSQLIGEQKQFNSDTNTVTKAAGKAETALPKQIATAEALIQKLQAAGGETAAVKAESLRAATDELKAAEAALTANGGNTKENYDIYAQKLQAYKVALEEAKVAQAGFTTQASDTKAIEKIALQADKAAVTIKRMREEWTRMTNADRTKLTNIEEMFNTAKLTGSNSDFENAKAALTKFRAEMQLAGKDGLTFLDSMKQKLSKFSSWFSVSQLTMSAVRGFKQMVSAVKELDESITSLKKVTNETDEAYQSYFATAGQRSKELSVNMNDYIGGTTGFARLGYDLDDAATLGEAATIYLNVADGVDSIEDSTSSLISTMQAFGVEASEVNSILDRFNYVGNNYAITSGGIGEVLQRSASSMVAANTSLDKTIALATAANTIVQDEEKVGTSLSTMSMRLRGSTAELETAGEEVDSFCTSTSKLQSTVKALSGVDIMASATEYKDVYQILQEISTVWDSMTDVNRASLLEALFGKRQANIGSAILSNFEIAEDVLSNLTSGEADGSAMKEYSTYLDSVASKQARMQTAFQSFSASLMDSSIISGAYDAGSGLLGFLQDITDNLEGVPTLVTLAMTAIGKISGTSLWSTTPNGQGAIFKTTDQRNYQINADHTAASNWLQQGGAGDISGLADEYKALAESGQASAESFEAVRAAQLAANTTGTVLRSGVNRLAGTLLNLGKTALSVAGQMAIIYGVTWVFQTIGSAIDKEVNKVQYAQEAAAKVQESWQEIDKEQKTTQQTMDKYSETWLKYKDNVDATTGKNGSLSEVEFESYQEAANALAKQFPELVAGWDAQGNAILNVNKNAQDLADTLERLKVANIKEELADANTVIKGAYLGLGADTNIATQGLETEIRTLITAFQSGDWNTVQSQLNSVIGVNGAEKDAKYNKEQGEALFRILRDAGIYNVAGNVDSKGGGYKLTSYSKEDLEIIGQALSNILSEDTEAKASADAQYRAMAKNYAQLAFSQFGGDNGAVGAGANIDADAQTILANYVASLDSSHYAQFGEDEAAMQAWIDKFVGVFADEGMQSALLALSNAVNKYNQGEISIGDLEQARLEFGTATQGALASVSTGSTSDADLVNGIRDATSGEWDVYKTQIARAEAVVTNEAEGWGKTLTSAQLSFAQGLEENSLTVEEFFQQFTDQALKAASKLSTVKSNWSVEAEAQSTANELMAAQDSNHGILTRENYDSLINANPVYASAVGVSLDGTYTIDQPKLQNILMQERQKLLQDNAQGLQETIELYEEASEELQQIIDTESEEYAAQQLKVDGLKDELAQRRLITQEIEFANSEYGRWLAAQSDGTELGDNFRELKAAVNALEEGMESGRTNTNAYQTSGDVLFGDNSGWRDWDNKTLKEQYERAGRLYDSEGQLDNGELFSQAHAAGVIDDTGNFISGLSVEGMAEQMGYGAQFMAQVLKAAKEYGVNDIQYSDEELSALLPQTEIGENTSAIAENTGAIQELTSALSSEDDAGQQSDNGTEQSPVDKNASGNNATTVDAPVAAGQEVAAAVDNNTAALDNLAQAMEIKASPALEESITSGEWTPGNAHSKNLSFETFSDDSLFDGKEFTIVYTPVTPDGKELSQEAWSEYVNGLLDGSEFLPDIVAGDNPQEGGKGIIAGIFTGDNQVDLAGELSAAMKEAGGNLNVDVGANVTEFNSTVAQAVASAKRQRVEIPVSTRMPGLPGFASGTTSAPGGTALVGELGSEIIVSRKTGTWRLASEPQITNLNKGDIVFNAQQTKRILSGSTSGAVGGNSFVNGTRRASFQNRVSLNGGLGGNGSSSTGTGGKGGGGDSSDGESVLDKIDSLYDWVERALSVVQKATQKIINAAAEQVGAVNKNLGLEAAIAATKNEAVINQQSYEKYMETASSVAEQVGLSDELMSKVRTGSIEILEYDDETQKKIKAYQEWYDKAQDCLDTLEDLRKQEKELALNKLDNIIDNYTDMSNYYTDQVKTNTSLLKYMEEAGQVIEKSDYAASIKNSQSSLNKLLEERVALKNEFNNLVGQGYIIQGSDEWYQYTQEISKLDQAVLDAQTNLIVLNDEMNNIPLQKLQRSMQTMQAVQAELQGMMALHDAQGTKNTDNYYTNLISNGMEQITILEKQNAELKKQQQGLEVGSSKWQELQNTIEENAQAILDMKASQEEWNDAIADLQITKLQEQRDELEKQNEAYERQLELQKAQEALEKAKTQRNRLVYREGIGFQYEADQDAIREAQEALEKLQHQEILDKIDDAIEAIEDNKENDNIYDYNGDLLTKNGSALSVMDVSSKATFGIGVESVQNALSLMDMASNGAQSVLSSLLRSLSIVNTTSGETSGSPNVVLSIGDIYVEGVENSSDLARQIVTSLPTQIIQYMHSNN